MIPASVKSWLAFGSGVGIQIDGARGSESLQIAAVKVRPSGEKLLDHYTVEDFPHQPAGVWGTDYAAFLKKLGLPHAVATVVLPRHDVIVRTLSLPGVSDKDLAGAVQFQLDGLHPHGEEDVSISWARLPGTAWILVSIARLDAMERYSTLFSEAGIRVGSFTSPAAVVYSALRLHGKTNFGPLLAYEEVASGGIEIYGESAVKPVFSAAFPTEPERAVALAIAELRFDAAPELKPLGELLGFTPALPYAAAMASACPRLALPINLLPASQRQIASPMAWVPAVSAGVAVLLLAGTLLAVPHFADRRYLKTLDEEIAKVQPAVARAGTLDRQIADAQKRTSQIDDFRRRARSDMDVLGEMTRLLPPPIWLNQLELNARQVTIAGETEQAAPLLQVIDASPLFRGSEFNQPPIRIQAADGKRAGESFRIRTLIEEGRR